MLKLDAALASSGDRGGADKVLNHADRSTTAIYERHEFFDEKIEAVTRWADHLDSLLAR